MKVIFCITAFFFSLSFNSMCQVKVDSLGKNFYKHCDTISLKQFNNLVKFHLKKMRKEVNVLIPEIIEIVKIYNSSPKQEDSKSRKRYKQFLDKYQKIYMGRACEMLNCVPLRGLVIYSKEYDLYLSSTKDTMACYNYFFIK